MSFSTEINKSVSEFRVLIHIDSKDGNYSGRFSKDAFTPIGSAVPYEGRLVSVPKISINRDSNQFGILVFSSSGFALANNDGEFDTLMDTYNIIGATVRVYIGYASLNISEYVNIYTGYIESVSIGESKASFSIADLRKRLRTGNSTDISYVDAVQGIENILLGNYAITAGSSYFDVSAMTAAKALAYKVVRIHPDNDTVDAAIEDCVKSTMGFFFITGDGRYSYKMIDTAATVVSTISRYDVLDENSIDYDEGGIIASVSVESVKYPLQLISTQNSVLGTNDVAGTVLDNGTILVGSWNFGDTELRFFKSTDKGMTFSTAGSITLVMFDLIEKLLDLGSGKILLLVNPTTTSGTIYRSTDYGSSWSRVLTAKRTRDAIHAGNGVCYAIQVDSAYATTGTNVYRSIDYGSSWTNVSHINVEFGNKMIQGSTTATVFIATGRDSSGFSNTTMSIYKSADSASSFSLVYSVTSQTFILPLDMEYAKGMVLLSVTYNSNGVIYKSSDECASLESIFSYSDPKGAAVGFTFMKKDANQDVYIRSNTGMIFKSSYSSDDTNSFSFFDSVTDGNSGSYEKMFLDLSSGLFYCSKLRSDLTNYDLYGNNGDENNRNALNNSYKASTYTQYGVDTLKHFPTVLAYYSDAVTLASTLIQYFKDLHGELSIEVPIKYYAVNVGDNINLPIWRETTSMLGTKKCEVLGKAYNLDKGAIVFNLRIIS